MSKFRVEFSRRATAQLRSIFSYIAQDNASAAHEMVDMLETRAQNLEDSPFIGVELPHSEYPFLPPGYRRLGAKPFLMYYRVIGNKVVITHIIHEKRNQQRAIQS